MRNHSVIVATFVCSLAFHIIGDQPVAQPILSLENDTVTIEEKDFRKSVLEGSITIENRGDTALLLKRILYACGSCTEAHVREKAVPPGGRTHLNYKLRLGLLDLSHTGHGETTISIESNDPSAPHKTITFKVYYHPDFVVRPETLEVHGRINPERMTFEPYVGRIVIRDYWAEGKLVLEDVKTSSYLMETKWYDITDHMTTGGVSHYIIVYISLAAGSHPGPVKEEVTLLTNHPDYREITIPLTGEIVGPLVWHPRSIIFDENRNHWNDYTENTITLTAENSIIVLGDVTENSSGLDVSYRDNGTTNVTLVLKGQISPLDGQDVTRAGFYNEAIRIRVLRPVDYIQAFRIFGRVGSKSD